jgi:hypothetical protein
MKDQLSKNGSKKMRNLDLSRLIATAIFSVLLSSCGMSSDQTGECEEFLFIAKKAHASMLVSLAQDKASEKGLEGIKEALDKLDSQLPLCVYATGGDEVRSNATTISVKSRYVSSFLADAFILNDTAWEMTVEVMRGNLLDIEESIARIEKLGALPEKKNFWGQSKGTE